MLGDEIDASVRAAVAARQQTKNKKGVHAMTSSAPPPYQPSLPAIASNPTKPALHNKTSNNSGSISGNAATTAPVAAPILTPNENNSGSTITLSAQPGEQAVYLPPFYFGELGVARILLRLFQCPPAQDKLADLRQTNFEKMFEYLAGDKENLNLADRQKEGVVMALTQPVGVLTGGPGTGKTTSMRALIRVLALKKKKVVLAAPTGRAAKRLSEATGLEAKTLAPLTAAKTGR